MPVPDSYTILITGAGSGLGHGLSLYFAATGHRVLATDKSVETVKATAAEGGANVTAFELDVSSHAHIAEFGNSLDGRHVDVLVNNAGLQHVAQLEDFPPEKWDHLIDVMLKGSAAMTRLVLPGMRQNNFGRIVNIGSIHSLVASPFKTAYTAAKTGLLGFSRVVALETADVDITINTVCPAYIRTPLVEKQIHDQALEHGIPEAEVVEKIMLEPMPKKAFITIEEVAAAIEYLISPAARNMTGQSLVLDGGWTCR